MYYDDKYKDHFQGRSQEEELEFLKIFFEQLGIPIEKIKTTLFEPESQEGSYYGDYSGCDCSIVVDKHGEIFSTSSYKENLWKIKDQLWQLIIDNKHEIEELLDIYNNPLLFKNYYIKIYDNTLMDRIKSIRNIKNLEIIYGALDFIRHPAS
ncbi:MAG: hypothetical protein Q8L85_06045 [Alphaproteobacteria bacterium]|nr:hypothetical protein [Alphaproteobacteria bacterium]